MTGLEREQLIVDGLLSPACIVAGDLRVRYANDEFLDMAKISRQDVRRGITCPECLNFDAFTASRTIIASALATGQTVKMRELKGTNITGECLSLAVSCIPLSRIADDIGSAMLVFSDLTLEENAEEKYKTLYDKEREDREKLEQFNQRLNELVEERTRELGETHRQLKTAYTELNEELETARNVQTALLPKEFPSLLNMRVAERYVPTGKVGGDLYDVIVTPTGKVAVLIFDVSGHGVPASLIGATAKMLFARHLDRLTSPAEIFAEVNRYIATSIKTDHYLTAFLGLIDPENNTMVYSKAAHPSPVVFRKADDSVELLQGKGLFIGHSALASVAQYFDETIRFSDGDRVLFYTDGLTEATAPGDEMFGTERLMQLVRKNSGLPIEDCVSAILRDHAAYTRGTPLRDDFTILCIELGKPDGPLADSGFGPEARTSSLTLASYDEIEKACGIVLREIDAKGYSEQDIWAAKLCMHELLINALMHGNGLDRAKKVTVLYKVTTERFALSIIDEGNGFDHANLPDPKNDDNLLKGGGRGLYFVRQYMDEMVFNDKGNRVMIVKNHTEGP